ncbi:MAG: hypothetical protein GY915_09125, partial [bacterium]|nr:hypothetical protein [bacterium]
MKKIIASNAILAALSMMDASATHNQQDDGAAAYQPSITLAEYLEQSQQYLDSLAPHLVGPATQILTDSFHGVQGNDALNAPFDIA